VCCRWNNGLEEASPPPAAVADDDETDAPRTKGEVKRTAVSGEASLRATGR